MGEGNKLTKREIIKENIKPKKRGDTKDQLERQKARRLLDKKGKDKNKNGKADSREGKDIHHKKPIRKGGKTTMKNIKIRNRSANRKDNKRDK